jgi:hypothetical protein
LPADPTGLDLTVAGGAVLAKMSELAFSRYALGMLPCPTCGANIQARNDALGIAACGACGGLFEWPPRSVPDAPIALPDLPPSSVRVERRDGRVRAIHWRSNASAGILAATLLVAFLVAGSYLFLPVPLARDGAIAAVLAIGAMLWHPIRRAVGIHIEVGPVITVRNGPSRRRRFGAASLRQPFVRSTTNLSYDLCAVQADGTVVTLVEGFSSPLVARYVEDQLEAALGIVDARVPGEMDLRAPVAVDATARLRSIRLVCPSCAAPMTSMEVQVGKGQAVCARCRKGMLIGGPVMTGPRTLVVLPPPRALVDRSRGAFAMEAGLGTGPMSRGGWVLSLAAIGAWVWFVVSRGDASSLIIWAYVGYLWLRAAWLSAARWWNHVRIHVEDEVLRVRVGPLPPRTRRWLPVSAISQFFVREQPKTFFANSGDGYQLCAIYGASRAGFQVIPLVGWMTDLREARYLEEQLEQYLGIDDAPVSGEVPGKMLRHEAGTPSLPGSGNLSLPEPAAAGGELSVPRAAGALSEPD